MKQLVLDLRTTAAAWFERHIASRTHFSAAALVFSKRRIEGVSEPYYADNPNPETMPLVVLLNRTRRPPLRSLPELFRTMIGP